MTRAFDEVLGVPAALAGIAVGGRTDAWILAQAAAAHRLTLDPRTMERLRAAYIWHLAGAVLEPGPRKGVLPGVRALLDALSARPDVHLALLTGNIAEGARIKLEYFDLWHYFRWGAFGDGALDRTTLLPAALARVAASGGPDLDPVDTVLVGDTPHDVAVAVAGGARSLAVATGSYDERALRASGADAVVPDLSDLQAVIEALGVG
jgi:phosphoglycolate phosphatase-like HAD superfamily hydrolase